MQQAQNDGVVSAMSQATDARLAAQDLARQLLHPHLGFVLFFCSAEYNLRELGEALEQGFGGIRLVGCTSAGEITPLGYGRNCVTAVGFDHRHFSIATELIDEMEHFSLIDAQQRVERLVGTCRSNTLAPIKGHSFALTLLDGLSSREEMILAALSAALGDIPHFGGSAGDDNYLTRTHVYFGGAFHSGAAVVVLVNTWLDFEVFTTHHILPRAEKLVVTGADGRASFAAGLLKGTGAAEPVAVMAQDPAKKEFSRLELTKSAFDLSDRGVDGRPLAGGQMRFIQLAYAFGLAFAFGVVGGLANLQAPRFRNDDVLMEGKKT